jgi:hypothetical protein
MQVIGILALSLTLAGCFEATSRPPGMGEVFMLKEQLTAKDDAICRGYGAQPGSDAYSMPRLARPASRCGSKRAIGSDCQSSARRSQHGADAEYLASNSQMPVGAGWHGNVADGLPIRALCP